MDEALIAQFARVDSSLNLLIESIAAYNPSPQAAIDLVAADEELSQGLDELSKHQANHARIQALRNESDALEEQLKSSVQKLATLRHELFDTPTTTFSTTSRKVPFDELLQYANHISKHTVPPTYREHVPDAGDKDKDKDKDKDTASTGAPTNGLNTPALPSATLPSAQSQAAALATTNAVVEPPTDGVQPTTTQQEITAEESEWLKKLKTSQIAWYPWPSVDKIRAGNLYKLQYYREKGYDPETFNIPAHEEAERRREMGEEDVEMQQAQQNEQQAEQQSAPAPAAVPRPPRPAPEAFTGFDDMDDE